MATGFRFGAGSNPMLMNCFTMWYSPNGNKEVAIACDGKFNAIVTNMTVHFRRDTTNNAFATVGEAGGYGYIENPVTDESLIHDKTYREYLRDIK